MSCSDTETESETDSPLCRYDACDVAGQPVADDEWDQESAYERSARAVNVLERMDISSIERTRDEALYKKIQRASNYIAAFLDNVTIEGLASEPLAELVFVQCSRASFLKQLFEFRVVFCKLASDSLHPGSSTLIITCWVDTLLAKLGEAAVSVATSMTHCRDNTASTGTARAFIKQSENDNVRAATQLPHNWASVLTTITSAYASPAAKRLSLRLCYAAFVMSPQLEHTNLDSEVAVQLLAAMQLFLDGISLDDMVQNYYATLPRNGSDLRSDRLNCAMMVALFASADSARRESCCSLAFKPYTVANLLRMIQFVMHPNEAADLLDPARPRANLDAPQRLLLHWENVLLWSWRTWVDERVADTQTITHMTSTWLCHLHDSNKSWPLEIGALDCEGYTKHSVDALLRVAQSISLAIRTPEKLDSLPATTFLVLFRACYAVVRIASRSRLSVGATACYWFFSIFPALESTAIDRKIKASVIEGLTLASAGDLQGGFKMVLEDTKLRFNTSIGRMLNPSWMNDAADFDRQDAENAKLILEFWCIILHSGLAWTCSTRSSSAFLASVMSRLALSKISCTALLASFLNMQSIIRSNKAGRPLMDPFNTLAMWKLALRVASVDMIACMAFSNLIVRTTSPPQDDLLVAETWECLRDALLLILSDQYVGGDQAVAAAASSSICHALLHLLVTSRPCLARFILHSPWTTDLCVRLRALLDADGPGHLEYIAVLRKQLAMPGSALVRQLKHMLHSKSKDASPETGLTSTFDLVYHAAQPLSHLLLLCRSVESPS